PWVIFTAVALLPFLDFGLRHLLPDEASKSFRDLSTAVTLISVLPLLGARIDAERAELQQASSTMRLMAEVIEQARELIVVMTPDGRCRHANTAFCRALGRARDELATLTAAQLLAHETATADEIQATARQGGAWRGTVMRTRKDGTTFPVSASVAAIVDAHGRPTHIVSVEQDITEERRLKEQLIQRQPRAGAADHREPAAERRARDQDGGPPRHDLHSHGTIRRRGVRRDRRRWSWRAGGHGWTRIRTVLHDEAGRRGHRPRPVGQPRDRGGARRIAGARPFGSRRAVPAHPAGRDPAARRRACAGPR